VLASDAPTLSRTLQTDNSIGSSADVAIDDASRPGFVFLSGHENRGQGLNTRWCDRRAEAAGYSQLRSLRHAEVTKEGDFG
jgi:hypothetical protein